MIEGVVFDLDGTLLDTLDDILDVVNHVFRQEGLPPESREGVRLAVGRGVENLVRKLVPKRSRNEEYVKKLSGMIRETYSEKGSVKTRPYPGIPRLIRKLSGQGMPMAVLTNKPHDSALESVEMHFGKEYFSVVSGADKIRPMKPSPGSADPVLKKLGVAPDRIMMVGDSDVDMDTATVSGMVPVGVSWGYRDTDLLLERGAGHIVNEPYEILKIIELGNQG
ncbi:MAG: HAD family hydrolase [Candidatus Aegiribacteria sp.]